MKKLLIPLLLLLTLTSSTVFSSEYSFSAHSRDGSSVCVGGKYGFSAHSRDGSDVAAQWNGD